MHLAARNRDETCAAGCRGTWVMWSTYCGSCGGVKWTLATSDTATTRTGDSFRHSSAVRPYCNILPARKFRSCMNVLSCKVLTARGKLCSGRRACGPRALFPCDWSGSVLTPQNPTDPKYAHQPDFGSVQQIAAMVARHWPAFFEKELGAAAHLGLVQHPALEYTEVVCRWQAQLSRMWLAPRICLWVPLSLCRPAA